MTAHPVGCDLQVPQQINYVRERDVNKFPKIERRRL